MNKKTTQVIIMDTATNITHTFQVHFSFYSR